MIHPQYKENTTRLYPRNKLQYKFKKNQAKLLQFPAKTYTEQNTRNTLTSCKPNRATPKTDFYDANHLYLMKQHLSKRISEKQYHFKSYIIYNKEDLPNQNPRVSSKFRHQIARNMKTFHQIIIRSKATKEKQIPGEYYPSIPKKQTPK